MKTVIEINGQKYDAQTGELIAHGNIVSPLSSAQKPADPVVISQPVLRRAAPAIDGFSRRKIQTTQPVTAKPAFKPIQARTSAGPQINSLKSLDIKPAKARAERAKTLLRTAVSKPKKEAPHMHSTSAIAETKVERSATGRGLLIKRVPDSRLARAKLATKSITISKFSAMPPSRKPRLSEALTVAPAPKDTKLSSAPQAAPALTKPVLSDAHEKEHVFHHSIAQATHHSAPKLKKKGLSKRVAQKLAVSSRVLSATAAVFAILILAAFFAYQNVPAVAMRVAANQAGFTGHIPSNPPAGFAFKGPIEFSKGNITLKYRSNSDDRAFAITQKPTDWTSDSLLTNHILSSKTRYQTYHDRGLTVFIFNDGNATWIDKGVWYSVSGKGSLSSDQVLSIAGSM